MTCALLLLLIFVVAMLYASVGHGGASGYLAVMSLLGGYSRAQMGSSALVLNLLVAGTACLMFGRAGHGSFQLLWPFVVGSVPAACVGGWLPVSSQTYGWLLAAVLCVAAVRLCLPARAERREAGGPALRHTEPLMRPRRSLAVLVGVGIGLISGVVGVGGGIFLSPLMMLLRWADAPHTAAASAGFIAVNSVAGLMGRFVAGRCVMGPLVPLIVAALAGGVVGSRWGANRCSGVSLRRLLALVLVIAAGKLVLGHG